MSCIWGFLGFGFCTVPSVIQVNVPTIFFRDVSFLLRKVPLGQAWSEGLYFVMAVTFIYILMWVIDKKFNSDVK